MEKALALIALFRQGSAVADPKLLQDRGALAIALTAALTALGQAAKAFGYPLPLDTESINLLAGGLAAAAYLVVHVASSPERGLLPAAGPDRDATAPGDAHAAAPVGSLATQPAAADPVRDQRADPTNLAGG